MRGSSTFDKKYGSSHSNVPENTLDESETKIKEAILEEKNIDVDAITSNYSKINSMFDKIYNYK